MDGDFYSCASVYIKFRIKTIFFVHDTSYYIRPVTPYCIQGENRTAEQTNSAGWSLVISSPSVTNCTKIMRRNSNFWKRTDTTQPLKCELDRYGPHWLTSSRGERCLFGDSDCQLITTPSFLTPYSQVIERGCRLMESEILKRNMTPPPPYRY